MLRIVVPGAPDLELEHLVLDANGTVTDRGQLIDGVEERVRRLSEPLTVHVVSADTFGGGADIAARLGAEFRRVAAGGEKREYVEALGATRAAAIGNGRNDEEMLGVATLGIAVLGPEGASAAALARADVVASSIHAALDLLSDTTALVATLRP